MAPEAINNPQAIDGRSDILACLAKDPSDRPQTAQELQHRVRACEGIEAWDGTWWWEEYGHVVRAHRREKAQPAHEGLTVAIQLAERT